RHRPLHSSGTLALTSYARAYLLLQFPARAIVACQEPVRRGDIRDLRAGGIPEESPAAEPQRDAGQVDCIADRECQREIAVARRASLEGLDPCGIARRGVAALATATTTAALSRGWLGQVVRRSIGAHSRFGD